MMLMLHHERHRSVDTVSAKSFQRDAWWTHKGSNLGPLPCEGNALPLSYASGIVVQFQGPETGNAHGQRPRFTEYGAGLSSICHCEEREATKQSSSCFAASG